MNCVRAYECSWMVIAIRFHLFLWVSTVFFFFQFSSFFFVLFSCSLASHRCVIVVFFYVGACATPIHCICVHKYAFFFKSLVRFHSPDMIDSMRCMRKPCSCEFLLSVNIFSHSESFYSSVY